MIRPRPLAQIPAHPQRALGLLLLLGCWGLPLGCTLWPQGQAQPQDGSPPQNGSEAMPPAVQTVIAEVGSVSAIPTYTGTTIPTQQASLRAKTAGQLIQLRVDVGDRVRQGQLIAQMDDELLAIDVQEAEAELASRQSEVAQAQAQVSAAQTTVEQARVTLTQAQADAQRLRHLANAGAIPEQVAEQAESTLAVAQQALASAQQQVQRQQAAVDAARGQVSAQRAIVARSQAQVIETQVLAPLDGVVVSRPVALGDVLQVGDDIVQIADFSSPKIDIQVSELDLATLVIGRPVQVHLDAFPNQTFTGRITRIAPTADPVARLIPVEVTLSSDRASSQPIASSSSSASSPSIASSSPIAASSPSSASSPSIVPNSPIAPNSPIGGLLARVSLPATDSLIVLPEAALAVQADPGGVELNPGDQAIVYVVNAEADQPRVTTRQVKVGLQQNGQVEIRSGIAMGEAVVIRSSGPLSDGLPVRLSLLSEPFSGP